MLVGSESENDGHGQEPMSASLTVSPSRCPPNSVGIPLVVASIPADTLLTEQVSVEDTRSSVPPIATESSVQQMMTTSNIPTMVKHQLAQQPLRLRASNVAAMTGFNPFENLPHLLYKLVYQGYAGQQMLHWDARALGVSLVASEDEIYRALAAKAGEETAKAVNKVLQVKSGQSKVASVKQAQAMTAETIQKVTQSANLTKQEVKVLTNYTRHAVNTGFGTCHETSALDRCEQLWNWEIHNRNCQTLEWPFQKLDNPVGDEQKTVEPIDIARPYWEKPKYATRDIPLMMDGADSPQSSSELSGEHDSKKRKVQSNVIVDLTVEGEIPLVSRHNTDDDVKADNDANDNKDMRNHPYPFFVICGKVDGVRDELYPGDPDRDDDSWMLRTIIVELKHRMNGMKHVPPLYEQIQAVTYCLMYQVDDCDLVEVVRQEREKETTKFVIEKQSAGTSDVKEVVKSEAMVEVEIRGDDGASQVLRPRTPASIPTDGTVDVICRQEASDNKGKSQIPAHAEGTVGLSPKDNDAKLTVNDKSARDITLQTGILKFFSPTKQTCSSDGDAILKIQDESDKGKPRSEITLPREPGSDPTPEGIKNENAAIDTVDNHDIMSAVDASTLVVTKGGDNHQPGALHEHGDRQISRAQRPMILQKRRVSLDDPVTQHRKYWTELILPRLRSFAEAVYSIRNNDCKRYRLLQIAADPLGQLDRRAWEILHDECPWLQECDTAFHRE